MIVVSNTSPILNLDAVGELHLLQRLYGCVLVPRAVVGELGRRLPLRFGPSASDRPGWVEERDLAGRDVAEALAAELHAGEAEVIALALETRANLALLDERRVLGWRGAPGARVARGR